MGVRRLVRILFRVNAITLGIFFAMVGSTFSAIPQQEWVARYNGPGNGGDTAQSVVTDDEGHVYVTGTSNGGATQSDYTTIKYDPDGNELWAVRYNGPGNCGDSAHALAVDIAGNAYVTGSSCARMDPFYGGCVDYDYATVKYDPEGHEIWVATFDGHGGIFGDADGASSIAVDITGNVYVTGTSCTVYGELGMSCDVSDYVTIKYDSEGHELWVAYYSGLGFHVDSARCLTLDDRGNVYVTGSSYMSGTGDEYATVKYDSDGHELWVARYNGPGNYNDSAGSVAVDTAGNVYVTGGSYGSGYDYATVKYDSEGHELWVARYRNPDNGDGYDFAYALAMGYDGNVYVTGTSYDKDTYNGHGDYATIKYDSDGHELWIARYNGPANLNDAAHAVLVDSVGNVYVTGESYGSESGYDYATIKYDPEGRELWVTRYNGPGTLVYDNDRASSLTLDPSGNIVVTGTSNYDYATITYDTEGRQLWLARYKGPSGGMDAASSLVIDRSGNVYVAGWSQGSTLDDDYVTIKYDAAGNVVWVARYNGLGDSYDKAASLTVDDSGNVYVTGESNYDYATIKYNPDGSECWVARYDGPGNLSDKANSIAMDNSGNVYVTGESYGSEGGYDYATIKYSPEGTELWVARYNGPGNSSDMASALALDDSGNVVVTGTIDSGTTSYDFVTIKYDGDGNELWVSAYDGPTHNLDRANALAIDGSGNVYVTGWSKVNTWDDTYATIKYDPDGNELWVARYDGPEGGTNMAISLAVDDSGNVYVTGHSETSPQSYVYDYATLKYDPEGNELWVARYNGPGNGSDMAHALALDGGGNVYVTGESSGFLTGKDFVTVKYDTEGNQVWIARYNGPGHGHGIYYNSDIASAIAVDGEDNVYVTGESYGSATDSDIATIKYIQGATPVWAAASPAEAAIVSAGAATGSAMGNYFSMVLIPLLVVALCRGVLPRRHAP